MRMFSRRYTARSWSRNVFFSANRHIRLDPPFPTIFPTQSEICLQSWAFDYRQSDSWSMEKGASGFHRGNNTVIP